MGLLRWFVFLLAIVHPALAKEYVLGVPGRYQYDGRSGFCGEVSLQMLMLEYGVWIPQEAARAAGSNDPYKDLLPGEDYNRALKKLKVRFEEFKGRGYKQFFGWAKRHLMNGTGVVEVAYIKGGAFSEYDHVMPMVGIKTTTTKYSNNDIVYVHTNYDDDPIQRRVGDYWCTRSNKKDSWTKAGCVPKDTEWGHAIKGPVYLGIGPPVELEVPSRKEPGLGKSVEFNGKLRIRNLTPGKPYKVYKITSLSKVPNSSEGVIRGIKPKSFNATKSHHVMKVKFSSNTLAYFICI